MADPETPSIRSMVLVDPPWVATADDPVGPPAGDHARPSPWAGPSESGTRPDPASATAAPSSIAVAERPAPSAPLRPTGDGSTVEARGVGVWFGPRKVLEGVDLVMPAGHVTALIGPSGCGKSTFLRTLNRMHELIPGAALAGSVLLDGNDIYDPTTTAEETRRSVGMVFQRPNPFPAMSIADNVLAGLRLTGRRAPNAREIVETSLRRAGLWEETKDRLSSSGAALSGGQQQRLCIARALSVQPKVLLMDEPCSALDPISTGVIEQTILALKHEVTIIIVTHNMQQAQRVSDQCALFLVEDEEAPGRIVESGPTQQMFTDPVDPRTLDYVSGRFG